MFLSALVVPYSGARGQGFEGMIGWSWSSVARGMGLPSGMHRPQYRLDLVRFCLARWTLVEG